MLNWFTTEKLLWDRSLRVPGIEGLARYRELATYDLLYVGIAKTGDSFDRLIARGHKARMEILANEPQRYPGARITDETFLFMFRVSPLVLHTFEPETSSSSRIFWRHRSQTDRRRRRKGIVSLLKPQDNIVKFSNYPKGADGLYRSEYTRYTYAIGEDLAFHTPHGRVRGACDPDGEISSDADFISVEGDKVKSYVSGVDFPGEESRGPQGLKK